MSIDIGEEVETRGDISRCVVCGSTFHWKKDCADADHDIWLYEHDHEHITLLEDSMESLVSKTWHGHSRFRMHSNGMCGSLASTLPTFIISWRI